MATELDALQLNFTARTSDADKSLDKLITQLTKVGQSIGAINSQGFIASMDNVSSTLSNLEFAVNNINSDKLKSISGGLNSLAKSISNFASGGNVSETLSQVANGIDAIGSVANTDFSNISVLANSISKLGSGGGTQASQNLIPIAEGLKAFTGINIPQLDGIETFANGLRSLGSKNVGVAASSLQPIADALRNFPTNIPAVSGLTELAQSLSLFGRKTAQEAVTTIPQLATAFRQLIAELASAPTVSNNIVQLTDALARFVSNVNRVGTSSTQASKGLNLFGNTASKVSKKTFSLAAAIGKIYATYFLLFRAFGKIKDAIDISSSVTEVQNVVDTSFGQMSYKVEEFAKTAIEQFGMSELAVKQFASRYQSMGSAMGVSTNAVKRAQEQLNKINPKLAEKGYSDVADSFADISLNMTRLVGDLASFYDVNQADVAKDLESILTGMSRPLRSYGLDLTDATLAEFAMKNGLDANIKSMTQAEKTLLRYQYVMANTTAAQGDFAKTNITFSNQIRMLQQNFARLGKAIGDGFIAWFRPMIVTINSYMDSIIAAVTRVMNALGKIFGWQVVVDDTGGQIADDTYEIADAWDDATGAAKKYMKQLLGIDELNNLTTNDGGSGSGDDGLLGGLSGMNITEPGGIHLEAIESDIDNLFDLGKKISDKLRDMLVGIDWESIYEKARGFGKGLADFLNGLIQPETFYQIGRTIAGALNTVSEAIISFFRNADWKQYGESFIAGLQGFFDEIHISTLGLIIGAWTIKKVGKFIFGGQLTSLLGSALAKKISGDPKFSGTVGSAILGSIVKGFKAIPTALSSLGGIGGLLTEDLAVIFGAGTATEIGLTIGTALIGGIIAAWGGWNLGQILYEKISGETIDMSFGEQMKEIFSSFADGTALDALKLWGEDIAGAFSEIGNAIKNPFDGISSWLDTNVFNPISMMASDLWKNIKDTWNNAKTWFNTNVTTPISTLFSGVTTRISQFFQGAWIIIKGTWQVVSGWFNTNIIQPVSTFFRNLTNSIGQFFSDVWNNKIVPLWNTVSGWFNANVITPVRTFFSNLTTSISTFFSTAWTNIKGVWNGVSNWFNVTILIPLKTNFQTVVTSIGGFFSSLWSDIQNGAKFAANGIIGFFEGAVNGIIDNINGFLDMFNSAGKFMSKITGDSWSGVDLIPNISIRRFEYGGFPSQGSLFVAGETYGQSEWVGNINGKTGVVSGYEITDIERSIRESSEQELALMRQQNALLQDILNKEFGITKNDIGKAAREYGIDYFNRTGNQAYVN